MTTRFRSTAAAAAFVMACVLPASVAMAGENEKPVQMKDVPPAVQRAITQQSKGGTLREISQEIEKGKTYYEAAILMNGHGKDVLIDLSGAVVEVEEEIDLTTLPTAVRAEVEKSIGKSKLLKLEALTKEGKAAGYEAHVTIAGKRSEIKMAPDGKQVAEASGRKTDADETGEEDDDDDEGEDDGVQN